MATKSRTKTNEYMDQKNATVLEISLMKSDKGYIAAFNIGSTICNKKKSIYDYIKMKW